MDSTSFFASIRRSVVYSVPYEITRPKRSLYSRATSRPRIAISGDNTRSSCNSVTDILGVEGRVTSRPSPP